ncbi:MAG: hypothetical protein ACJAZD_000234 [Ilumatobacter sp.]|jgi:hypothetical protein|tara:strand:+ start:1776 stop:1913 length:138 start_codon:yes stop_codon:yes gene_type:complete
MVAAMDLQRQIHEIWRFNAVESSERVVESCLRASKRRFGGVHSNG